MRLTSLLTEGKAAHFKDDTAEHKLTSRELYLFSNCARHGDTLGIILGAPLACLAKVLVQKRIPAANPYVVFLSAGVPVLVASWAFVTGLYMANTCWGYLRLLPDSSPFKTYLLEEEKRQTSWSRSYSRFRAVTTVMSRDAHVDMNLDLPNVEHMPSGEQHDIQSQLRWVPQKEHRIFNRFKHFFEQGEYMNKAAENIKQSGLKNVMKPHPIVDDERYKSSHRPLPRIPGPSEE